MKILHTGDWHLGKSLEGHSRMDEQELFLNDFVQIVERNNVDFVIIAGDIYDSSNPPARAEKMFYNTLKKLSKNGERLTLVIAGNHDSPERLVAAGPLAMEHGIIMVGTPKTVVGIGEYGKHKVLNSGEGFIEIEINGERAVILTVPYPSEKRLNEALYGDMDSDEERLEAYGDRIKELFNKLSKNYREDTINLVVSHLFSMGSEESGSERSIQLGGSYIVDGSCFPNNAQYIALGHVHKPQIVPHTDKRARYSGSPLHYNKKEISFTKKCFVIDIEAGKQADVKDINFKVYKPIEIWKCNNLDEALEKCEENKNRDCYVYLEIKTDSYIKEDEIKALKDLKDDILEITPIISGINDDNDDSVRLSEQTFDEIFRSFYKKERGVDADDEIVELLQSILMGDENINETN
ncbi:exonuclease SbcCD subunit D [Sedimentibacter sp. zth1]|uniref:exonuclease SbcCD subunit D n=1 Tax=Sedimentibacter sp. zth1 TaxID=2816908 RepID=UPI001A92E2EE|nr:exonuclease SbcCD subunit D [Sedimentibacter sp. zth1]QSX06498.1 exonuclease SbcCD subunit D [Sedimentibacter sp. zth1]